MNYLSVCSGIEAATVAWHPLGWKPVGFAEIEPFPAAVLAHHYPTVPNFGDMTQLHDLIEMGICDAPEILVGGTPCQAFSVAGLRKSLDDARGNLALVYCDLANAIDARRKGAGLPPAILVWENVPGVLSTKDNAFGCFLAGLAGEDEPLVPTGKRWQNAGYVLGPQRAVAWRILDAQYFGLAQRRRRVFVVASARDGFDPATVLFEWEGVRRDSAPSREAGEGAAAGTLRRTDGGSDVDHARAWHILPITMAYGQGGAEIGFDRGPQSCYGITDDETVTRDCLPTMATPSASGGGTPIAFSCKDYGADVGEIAPTLRSMGHDKSHANAGGQVAIAFNARQDPDLWHDRTGPLDTDGGTQAVAFAQNSRDEVRLEGGDGQPPFTMQVRRLTPVECERLQGFQDDYTRIPLA